MKSLYFLGPNPTCDLIIKNHQNEILLIKRGDSVEACPNQWALPGGFIDTLSKKNEFWQDGLETPQNAAIRELKEETNLTLPDDVPIQFIGVFEGNNRDPRDTNERWTKSFAFYYEIPEHIYEEQKSFIKGMDDAQLAHWVNIYELDNIEIAFDHRDIIEQALQASVKKKLTMK